MYKLVVLRAINVATADKVLKEFEGASQASPDERHKEGHNLKIKIFEQRNVEEFLRKAKRECKR